MALILLDHYVDKEKVFNSFRSFLVEGGILNMSAGIIIGIATANYIKNITTDFIIPLIFTMMFGWMNWVVQYSDWIKYIRGVAVDIIKFTDFDFGNAFRETLTWLLSLFATFFVLEYVVRRTLLSLNKKEVREESGNKKENGEGLESDKEEAKKLNIGNFHSFGNMGGIGDIKGIGNSNGIQGIQGIGGISPLLSLSQSSLSNIAERMF